MKFFLVLLVCSSAALAAPSTSKKAQPNSKAERTVKNDRQIKEPNTLDKKPEADCDEKAKKPIDLTNESISLSGGATGCSLDEAHP